MYTLRKLEQFPTWVCWLHLSSKHRHYTYIYIYINDIGAIDGNHKRWLRRTSLTSGHECPSVGRLVSHVPTNCQEKLVTSRPRCHKSNISSSFKACWACWFLGPPSRGSWPMPSFPINHHCFDDLKMIYLSVWAHIMATFARGPCSKHSIFTNICINGLV